MEVVEQYESRYDMLFLKHAIWRTHTSVTCMVGMMALEVYPSLLPLYSPPTFQAEVTSLKQF